MNASSSAKFAIGVTVAAVVVLAAAFMPWGEVRGTPKVDFGGGALPFGDTPFGGMELTLTITGWNGNVTLGGLKVPNWLVVLAAGGVTLMSWLTALGVWKAPAALPIALAAYGLGHAGFALVVLMGSEKGSAGVGVLLTALAFIGMLVAVAQQIRAPKPGIA